MTTALRPGPVQAPVAAPAPGAESAPLRFQVPMAGRSDGRRVARAAAAWSPVPACASGVPSATAATHNAAALPHLTPTSQVLQVYAAVARGTTAGYAQNGNAFAAARATSTSGCTAKNEPTVTATAIAMPLPSTSSRGGEPPAGASCSSMLSRRNIARTTAR